MPRKAVDYNKTIIYKLVKNDDFDNENIYVGSTTEFVKRKFHHKHSCCNENSREYNRKVYQTIRENGGWENWKMIEIEKFPCEDKREAEAQEEYWRCEFNARLNSKRAFITKKQRTEYDKQYKKQYRTENADKIKQYLAEHADKITQKYNCDCGGKYLYISKSRHFKSKKHLKYLNNKIETI